MGLFDPTYVCEEDTIKLSDLIPPYYFDPEDDTTDRFVDIFEGMFCQLLKDIENLGKIIDVDITDEIYLDMLIRNLGFDLNVKLTVNKKRKLVKVLLNAYKQKGTCQGIENVIRQFVGIDTTCFPFTQGWILDVSELSLDTYLNPAPDNSRGFYTFDVIVETVLSTEQRRIILDLIELMKPAHTHFRELVESGEDAFVIATLKVINRGSLYLKNNQNNDGGWDANQADGNLLNISDVQNVSSQALGCYFASVFNTELEVVDQAFKDGASKLVNDASYNFSTARPIGLDIFLLNRATSNAVAGASTKRDDAILSFVEFGKAIAFLNNFGATSVQIAATTQPERDTTTTDKQAKFHYLFLTNAYGLARGTYEYVLYMRDLIEVSQNALASSMAKELNARSSAINFDSGYGNRKILALSSIVWALQQFNIGLIYENRITNALNELDLLYNTNDRQYYSLDIGTGELIEQAITLNALMSRQRYDRAKSLINGIRARQNVQGWIDSFVSPGTKKLRDLGAAMDSIGRAIKFIQDNGI